jgi:hypothetical protein
MLWHQPRLFPITAADCNDRPSAVLRSSSKSVSTYGCESDHLRLIVAVDGRQNENKALRIQEIGQTRKNQGMAPGRDRWANGFPPEFAGETTLSGRVDALRK